MHMTKEQKERKAEYMKAWRKANPDYQKKWYAENKERKDGYLKEWRKSNPGYDAKYMRAYRAAHPEYRKRGAESHKNYLLSLAEQHPNGYVSDDSKNGENSGNWKGGLNTYPRCTEFQVNRLVVLNDADWECDVCGKEAKTAHHLDGTKDNHSIENLMPVCAGCHGEFHGGVIVNVEAKPGFTQGY